MSNTFLQRNITAELQIGVDLVSISEVKLRHDTKYELRARAVEMSDETVSTVETDVQKELLVDTEPVVTILSARIHPAVITEVASSSTIRTGAISVIPFESVFSVDYLEHKETTIEGELRKFLDANTWEVSETILEVKVKPSVVSTYQTFFTTFTEAVTLKPAESIGTIGQISHKETFIKFERDRFSALAGTVTFNFEVTETNVGVKVNPVSHTVSFISHASELKAEVKKEPVVVSTQSTVSTEGLLV